MLKDDKALISNVQEGMQFVRILTPTVTCSKCGTTYPIIDGYIMCNGKMIDKCLCGVE